MNDAGSFSVGSTPSRRHISSPENKQNIDNAILVYPSVVFQWGDRVSKRHTYMIHNPAARTTTPWSHMTED